MKGQGVTVPSATDRTTSALLEQRTNEFTHQMRQQQDWMSQQAANLAATNLRLAQMKSPDVFQKYGPEIDATLRQFDPSTWTPQGIDTVVDMVRGRHYQELAQEHAERIAAQRAEQERNSLAVAAMPRSMAAPSAPPPSSNVLDRVTTPVYKAALDRLQLTQKTVDEFLAATYMKHDGLTKEQAEEKWVAQVNRGDVITDGKEMISPVFGYDHNPPRR